MLLSSDVALWFFLPVFLWLGLISFFVYQSIKHYKSLTEGSGGKNLESILEKIVKDQEEGTKKNKELVGKIEDLEKNGSFHIQKIGLTRFNPFSDTGGDQSFALALLNQHDTGFIISSLHSRDNTRIYAKPVDNGKAVGYEFAKEEQEAIDKACKHKNGK